MKQITAEHYEAGNQAKCYKAVWRRWIWPQFKICYRTYLNLIGIDPDTDERKPPDQPNLFSGEM